MRRMADSPRTPLPSVPAQTRRVAPCLSHSFPSVSSVSSSERSERVVASGFVFLFCHLSLATEMLFRIPLRIVSDL